MNDYIYTVAYAMYLLAVDKISFETDILIQFFECSSFELKTIPIPLYLININHVTYPDEGKGHDSPEIKQTHKHHVDIHILQY